MRWFLTTIIFLSFFCYGQGQGFEPIPQQLKPSYQFNLPKNFFLNENDYYRKVSSLSDSLAGLNLALQKSKLASTQWVKIIRQYAKAEADYRVIDLYLFLRFAINMNDVKADMESDSIRNIIRKTRSLIKQKISNLTAKETWQILRVDSGLSYYINGIRKDKLHILTPEAEKYLQPYAYSRSSRFYEEAIRKMKFEKLITPSGEIDVIQERGEWENNPDTAIQLLGQQYVLKGYAGQKDFIGFNYIQFIKGLNAYSISKNFRSLMDEKLYDWGLDHTTLDFMFRHIINGARQRNKIPAVAGENSSTPIRFTIDNATAKLVNALSILGSEYKKELGDLLNPGNGRMDIAGTGARMPIRGMASVYPVYPSIFYAMNYEGYLIDLSVLSHEAGHAVQASLMHRNSVPLLYATGPAYFTESFGIFNELLLFDYLSTHETDSLKRDIYINELRNRISGLFGSTTEAYVEKSLVTGIIDGTIQYPEELDRVTERAGSVLSPEIFKSIPEYKGLWMLLESNYQAPLHNINDMIASALAVKYYQLFKADKNSFVVKYIELLKNGYYDTPANLLKKLGINIQDEFFIKSVVEFALNY
jgi:oligoendopeptidase F